jgi:Acetyltransferase (GNAT) family.
MDYIRVDENNIETEHICCAISNNKDVQVASKKEWMRSQFENGLVFCRSTERGKCFIEYIDAENAWVPVLAPGYLFINCFWVSGSLKGHGYASQLLDLAIKDANERGRKGLAVLSSAKKRPFLSDPGFLRHKGFLAADESECGINLMYLPLFDNAAKPSFTDAARMPHVDEPGFVLYYTSQCPFNAKYVPLVEKAAAANGIPFTSHHLKSGNEARSIASPVTSFALFYNGKFITNEVQNEARFLKLASLLTEK